MDQEQGSHYPFIQDLGQCLSNFAVFFPPLYHPVSLLSRWGGAGIHGRGLLLLLRVRPRLRALPGRRRRRGPVRLPRRRRRRGAEGASSNRHPAAHSGHKKHPWAMVRPSPSTHTHTHTVLYYVFVSVLGFFLVNSSSPGVAGGLQAGRAGTWTFLPRNHAGVMQSECGLAAPHSNKQHLLRKASSPLAPDVTTHVWCTTRGGWRGGGRHLIRAQDSLPLLFLLLLFLEALAPLFF